MKLIIPLLFLLSCNQTSKNDVSEFQQLYGKILSCTLKNIKTSLFFFSPHILAIPIQDKNFEFEYFQSVGSKKDSNSIYYQTSFKGRKNFQTQSSKINDEAKRLKITLKDKVIYITAISKLDEKNIPVAPVVYTCNISGDIKFN